MTDQVQFSYGFVIDYDFLQNASIQYFYLSAHIFETNIHEVAALACSCMLLALLIVVYISQCWVQERFLLAGLVVMGMLRLVLCRSW
jgi:hypothetical protein